MLLAGSDDGVYRLTDPTEPGTRTATAVLDSGRVLRVRTFDALPGVFAATRTGLYHSPDGVDWTDLAVPTEQVYAVGADGRRLYAGTRPAAVYVTQIDGTIGSAPLAWRELDGFQDLPSRGDWRLPRHENLAQVKDLHAPAPERLVAGVEVGGVHSSDDGGKTWTERRDGVDDDIHELRAVSAREWLAATGDGLYRTTDGGGTWTRLDDDVEQRYFRAVLATEGGVYAAGAMANSSTWEDDDADPALFRWDG
ncbi:MAG: hypothetical protein J07HX64_00027 [halophilic archaeon J07HX64]|jgi:hypothetical protein|nr:MAG: hypothetical protein J07HX64_00027 [halophilic archaeon J07HX64]